MARDSAALGVSRETVKKYAQMEDRSPKPASRPARLDRAPDGGDHGTAACRWPGRSSPTARRRRPWRRWRSWRHGCAGRSRPADVRNARLLRQAGFPQSKELDGYDWTPVRFPVDCGRESLEFTGRHEDVVLFGPPGTGKTHLAIALGRKACREGTETRFSAVRRTGRAPAARQNGQPARQGTRHDRQGGAPDHRRARLRARR